MKKNDTVAHLESEIKDVRRRMGRFLETGDIKRMLRLRARLSKIEELIALLQKEDAERSAPKFRKSYSFEDWCDSLAADRTSKPFYD
jgi:hypothetical protein